MHAALGVVSVVLLLALAAVFLRGAWRDLRTPPAAPPPSGRFDGRRAGYLLGATMALTSPWNVAFWLAAVGRPELSGAGFAAILVMVAAVIAGALTWGIVWSAAVVLLRTRTSGRAWGIAVKLLTAALMIHFAIRSASLLFAGA